MLLGANRIQRGFFHFYAKPTRTNMAEEIKNFLPLSRRFFEHKLWKEDRVFSRAEAWLDLLQLASYEDEAKRIIRGARVTWERGELPGSVRYFAERWKWSKDRVCRFFSILHEENMIKTRTANETDQTIISICNYESYNITPNTSKDSNKDTDKDTGKDTGKDTDKDKVKNIKKVKNVKKGDIGAPHIPQVFDFEKEILNEYGAILETQDIKVRFKNLRDFIQQKRPTFPDPYLYLWNLFAKKHGLASVSKLTETKRAKFKARLREEDFDFVKILHKCEQSPMLLGGDGGWKVNWDFIFRSEDTYINILDGKYDNHAA